MSTPAVYRFLPFTRRGLVAELRDSTAAAEGDLPQRASIKLDVTLSDGLGGASTTTALAGPGDVVGLDPRSIVRLTPRRDATNVEPNYLVAVDFDEPDLPWLLTPAAADAQGRLRPWLALVVVEARPGVSIDVPAGAPLPQLRIDERRRRRARRPDRFVGVGPHAAAGRRGLGPAGGRGAAERPRSSRVAPAVPATTAGRARAGSPASCRRSMPACGAAWGWRPLADQPLRPAWTGEDEVTLPLYFHWEFSTGPAGDFESLARRLQPFKVGDGSDGTPTVGTVKLHIGAAGGPVDLPDGAPGADRRDGRRAARRATARRTPRGHPDRADDAARRAARRHRRPVRQRPRRRRGRPAALRRVGDQPLPRGHRDRLVPGAEPRPADPGRRRARRRGGPPRAGGPDDRLLGAGRLGAGGQHAALPRRAVDPGIDPAAPALDRPSRAGPSAHVRRAAVGSRPARRGDRARRDRPHLAAGHHRRPGAAPAAGADGAVRPQGDRRPTGGRRRRRPASSTSWPPGRWPSTPPTSCRRACCRRRPNRHHLPHRPTSG